MEEQAKYKTKKQQYVIGIDPDVDKSGVALLDVNSMTLSTYDFTFPYLLEFLKEQKEKHDDLKIYVEFTDRNRANWHISQHDTARSAARKGFDVGRNQGLAKTIIEMAEYMCIAVYPIQPFRKCWQGKDGKITHEELKRLCQMSGIEFNSPRSNQEERDAALLVITCSGLPIKYKVVESNFNK